MLLCCAFLSGVLAPNIFAEEPLHSRIDAVLAKSQIGPAAPEANDAEFLRRITLDLTGRIPSTEAARKFLDDQSPGKRGKLIEELLNSPACDLHLAKVFDIMLMQRRPDKHVKAAEWNAYLLESFQTNKPYHQMAKEILGADGVDPKLRAPVKFYLDRDDMETHLVTRDTARVFFGRDLECAQCHDHPLISDYEQSEYYGLLAFLNRSSLFQPDKKKPAVLAEKAEGNAKFKSVFTGYEGDTRPRLPGEKEITEPAFPKGQEYQVKPAKNVRPVPKFSRRQKFAELATAGTNEAFNNNITNRLWAVMLGRGLVNPVDLHHPDNPPSSPELLALLSSEFVKMNYNIKGLLKEIALSNTYQRSFRMPGSLTENIRIAEQELPKAQAEHQALTKQADSFTLTITALDAQLAKDRASIKPLQEKAKPIQTQLAAIEKKLATAKSTLAGLTPQLTAKTQVANLLAESVTQINLASAQLPRDKNLAETKMAITIQANVCKAFAAKLQKQVEVETTAIKTLEPQLAALRKQYEPHQSALAQVQPSIQKVEAELKAVREQQEAVRIQAETVQRRIDRLALLGQFADTATQLAEVQQTAHSIPKEIAGLKAETSLNSERLLKSQELQKIETQKHDQTKKTLALAVKQVAAIGDGQNEAQTELDVQVRELETSAQKSSAVLAALAKSINETQAALKQSQQKIKSLTAKQKDAQDKLAKAEEAFELIEKELTETWTKHFRVASVEHLSPEQLAWSVLQAVGQVELQERTALAAWTKKNAALLKKPLTPAQQAEQTQFIEQTMHDKLNGLVGKFLPLFAASSGQPQHEFFATVDQALFFANGNEVQGWLRPSGGNLTDRVRKMTEPKPMAEELYLTILTRKPTALEIQDVTEYLSARKDQKDLAIQEIAWALLTSAEFRFQH